MDLLFHRSYPLHPTTPDQLILDRVRAKVELWGFLEESVPELLEATQGDALLKEIIGACIYTLHPHYTGIELLEEIKLILLSLKIEVPGNYTGLFACCFGNVIERKIKGS